MLEKENEHFQRAEARALEAQAEAVAEKAMAAEKAEAEKEKMIAAAEKAALKAMLDQQAAEAEAHRRRRQEQYKSFQQQRPSAERMASSTRGRSFDTASLRRGCVTIDEEPTVINSPRRGSSKRTGTSAPPGGQGARGVPRPRGRHARALLRAGPQVSGRETD